MSSRSYTSLEKDRETIVAEVVSGNYSSDWFYATETETQTASQIEKSLRKYNIGYIDDKKGRWGYKLNGTKHFTALKLLGFARNKMNNLMENLKF